MLRQLLFNFAQQSFVRSDHKGVEPCAIATLWRCAKPLFVVLSAVSSASFATTPQRVLPATNILAIMDHPSALVSAASKRRKARKSS